MLRKGDFVWLKSSIGVPIGAEVTVSDTGQLRLVDDDGKEHKITKKMEGVVRPMHPTSVSGVEDMIRLGDLSEEGLLRNLLVRHREGHIYTYTGSILVAVNPYQLLPIYTTEHVHKYSDRRLGELPPHVFAIANNCFFNMRRNRKNQCCVISGESGAGKTESTKLMLQFLAAVSRQRSWIEQQILEANPILEAFGNAKTIRNDNSSRFGKYVDIKFTKGGAIEGARIEQYLLEKSRVCRQASQERNYHIFYYMLMGMPAEQKKKLSLGSAAEYKYLTMGNSTVCEGRDDRKEYAHFRSALKILTFTDDDSWEICRLLAAILHLGNVKMEGTIMNNLEACDVVRSSHFNMASKLLEVNSPELEKCLTQRSIMTTRESVTKALTVSQAVDGMDAFAKAIYGKLFIWVVDKINSVIYKDPEEVQKSIGLLDIFGFENFNHNSFEQLCINFANEQLQQFFVRHIFKLEQEEYAQENIVWTRIDYQDNQRTLDMLATKSLNMLALIDEESHFPKGTDTTMLEKINQVHGKGGIYLPPKNNYETQFGVQHFAGVVYYDAKGFLEKNRDMLSPDLVQLVKTSTNKFLKAAFGEDPSSSAAKGSSNPKMVISSASMALRQAQDSKKRIPTLVGQFRWSLDSLMKTLSACQPYFIRCIKPNDYKKPMLFDRDLCMRQLRYSGMMETIRIRKAGYPMRYTFEEFLGRYRVLLKGPEKESVKKSCESICKTVLRGKGDWKTGKTKMFLKDFHDTMLEMERLKELNRKALIIQRVMQGFKHRRQFLRQRASALVIQKYWRGYRGRKIFKMVQHGFARLQAQIRSRQLHNQYRVKRGAAIVLQAHFRGHAARKEWRRKRQAVILLQSYTRGMLARKALDKTRRHMFLSAKQREEEHQAMLLRQANLEEMLRLAREKEEKSKSDSISDQEMVDSFFGFLPLLGQDEPVAGGYENVAGRRLEEIDIDDLPMEDNADDDDIDADEYSFSKFASMYFQGAATPTYVCQRLRQPLLHHEDRDDVLASLTVWWIILRFMGDLPEPKAAVKPRGSFPLLNGRDDFKTREGATLDRPLTTLEKLHIIVGYAIIRSDLRDEIYCQICKQLQNNLSRNSFLRGWILLALCVGIFPPSQHFSRYLLNFIRSAPAGYASYCSKRLRRTAMNGVRGEPPAWLELQATKTKKPIVVAVTLMDGRSISLSVDSASTSGEVCQALAKKVQLSDSFGFSLYVSMYEKVWALGSGQEHLMDAISQCEQEVKRRGKQEQHAPWRLFFRKEIFTPWHDCAEDWSSTDLIYRQIVQGLKLGEYRCDQEDAYVELAAKHLYVQHGSRSSTAQVKEAVHEIVSASQLEAKTEAKWVQVVEAAHSQGSFVANQQQVDAVKAEVVDYAREKWPMLFSRFFKVGAVSGPQLPKSSFIVAVNWTGLTFLDEKERKLLALSFPEVTGVNAIRGSKGQAVRLVTLKGDFGLSGRTTEDMAELITMFLSGLTERSQYAITLKEADRRDDPTFLSFRKGELIAMIRDNEFSQQRGWIKGCNERTGKTGAVPIDAIFILPILSKPSKELMNLLSLSPNQRKDMVQKEMGTIDRQPLATLKDYAINYFRQPSRDVNRQVMSRNASPEQLWLHSREPIRQPLLKKLLGNPGISHKACLAFTAILKYMGDYPTKQQQSPLDLTDQIFEPATQFEVLRDEIYCQIMKQMTSNRNQFSVEQGWQLLWLCCGLFPPSQPLLKFALRFLESRERAPLASDCLRRLHNSLRTEPRKLPPHPVEVDAIQLNSTQIFHKVYFPNDTEEKFEVATSTRVRDLIRTVATKLDLSSADGYSIFAKTQEKLLSLADTDYFFDSLRQIVDWSNKNKRNKEGSMVNVPYQVFFMRKLWLNVVPGKDPQADRIFHFPQELPKYLRGYHNGSREETVSMAALLLRIKTGSDQPPVATIPRMLKELVPADQLKAASENEWKKSIQAALLKRGRVTVDEAKLSFLKVLYRWPTFGCAFFEVKQTSEPAFPDIVRIAISSKGLTMFNPKTKEELASYPFNRIASWSSGSTYFHMTLGNLVKGSKFLCETSLGYKMDDLITSYVNMYFRERRGSVTRNQHIGL